MSYVVNKDLKSIESKNIRGLVRKIRDYKDFLKNGFSIKGYGFSIKAIYLEQN